MDPGQCSARAPAIFLPYRIVAYVPDEYSFFERLHALELDRPERTCTKDSARISNMLYTAFS